MIANDLFLSLLQVLFIFSLFKFLLFETFFFT